MREVVSRNNLNRKLKYSIRKKKNGGGAASFIVGSVVLGGLMLGGATTVNADGLTQTGTGTDTSAKPSGSTDISGTEVTLPKSNTVETTANQKEDPSAVRSDNVVSTPTMNQNKSGSTENSENPVDPTNEKQTANETTGTKSSDTDVKNDNLTQSPTNARKLAATAATIPESQLANNKVTISNFKVDRHVIRESEGLYINFSFDWSGQGLVKGDTLVVPLSDAFTSIARQVSVPFASNGQQVGTMVLDYDAKKIYTTFTADMDPNKIYNGTINVGTFVNRNYFINKDNKNIVELDLPNGQKEAIDLQIIFDAKDKAPELGIITVQADKTIDNPDGSINITWDAIVNTDKIQMSDAAIYVTPDVINGINPKFKVPGDDYSSWTDMNFEYDSNSTYSLNKDSFRVYQANVYASMGYTKGKELVKDKDYEIVKSEAMPNAYLIYLIGDYATTSSPIVVEYSGTVPAKNVEKQATTDAFVAYYKGPSNSSGTRYTDSFDAHWSHGAIYINNSSVTTGSPQNVLGSVSVVHIDATTGKLLKPEAYVEKDGTPLHNVEQGTKYKTTAETFTGYKFTTMGYDSAPAEGTVKEGHQRVIYLYVPETPTPEVKKGNVDVTYVAEDGTVLEATSDVVKDGKIGSSYETEQKSFDDYTFKRMGEFSADATGKVEEGTKHVVYIYAKNPETPEEKKGNVDVKYITTDGKVLEDVTSVKENAPVGEDYTTEEKGFTGYHFVGMDKTSDPATGVVAEGTKHVIYVYEKDVTPEVKKGNVDVTYVAEDGKVLKETSDVVKDGEIGSSYETEQKSFDGYTFKRMGEFSADATGKVEEGTKHVVYIYAKNPETPEEKKGNVDVKYITTDGKVLEDVT
ncbi:MucBP domain-containing protein, partial [Ligilactobacillus salivarius]|uniref:MucBP domain-containing protein n=1 Tax=Ligilactobacillus salivarius TaxID=1624 RepID=UPI0031FEDCF1